MIRKLAIAFSAVILAGAAENPWDKVKELKSGTEIRIYRNGVAQPIEAKLDEARDDVVVVVVKNEQKAIAKDEIVRLDARPKGGSRVTTETTTKTERPDARPQATPQSRPPVPGQSTSSGVSFGGKPAYETIYRRVAHSPFNAPPKK
jgi:hypothetical protein